VREVDAARWPDFEWLFESRGGPRWCWCRMWRRDAAGRMPHDRAHMKESMRQRIAGGGRVGLLAYVDGEPAAWCSVAPRETFVALGGVEEPGEDESTVWSLTCFYVRNAFRHRGLMDRLIERARELGTVVAALRNVHHLGRIGTYAEMAVAAGMVSIHFVNVTGHPPLVAPYRGSHGRFATNPICIGVPGTARHEPFLLDMATGLVAVGKVRVALNKGEEMPPGTLVDAGGQPTTDPKVMFPEDEAARGAILPFGLHKGYCFLFAAELLAGVLGGGGTSNPETHELDTICNHMLTVVIDPASLVEPEWMEREIDKLVDYVTSSPPANPDEPVLVPGDPERMNLEKRMAEGVPVDPVTWDGILAAGELVGLPRSEAAALLANA